MPISAVVEYGRPGVVAKVWSPFPDEGQAREWALENVCADFTVAPASLPPEKVR